MLNDLLFSNDFFIATVITIGYMIFIFILAFLTERSHNSFFKKLASSAWFYAISLSIYCTSWTFYGSIGLASKNLLGFLPVYLGPTITASLFYVLHRKIIRISKTYSISTIADFLSARYGKSYSVSILVTFLFFIGTLPYISLQLKGIHSSFETIAKIGSNSDSSVLSAFFVTVLMIVFSIVYGTRKLDTLEKHDGMMSSIFIDGVVKLFAFLLLGVFAIYITHKLDLDKKFYTNPKIIDLLSLEKIAPSSWLTTFTLSFFAIILLPHMFQAIVVENKDETHLKTAGWLFPFYLFLINLPVIPILFLGIVSLGESVDPDRYALALPMFYEYYFLAYIVYLGGLASAIGMAFLAVISLSTMLSNSVIVPFLIKKNLLKFENSDTLRLVVLTIRRLSIIILFLLAFAYYQTIGKYFALVSIGLVSFSAVFQLAPAFIGGLYWKKGNKYGALAGISAGFLIWGYTLPLPQLIKSGFLDKSILEEGPFGIAILNPESLLGLSVFDPLTHSFFWSLVLNSSLYVVVSILTRPRSVEANQAINFTDIFLEKAVESSFAWRGGAKFIEVKNLLTRFLGVKNVDILIAKYEKENNIKFEEDTRVDTKFLAYAESILSSSIGTSSARHVISMVANENSSLRLEEMLDILDESKKIRDYTEEIKQLKEKQDGDYYLTSLLLQPLSFNDLEMDNIESEFMLKQFKTFIFRKWHSELGGDLCITSCIQLQGKPFAFFLNSDAMGKSLQGAGGAIVLGSIIRAVISRTRFDERISSLYPELWLKRSFLEAQKIFETFQGRMVISLVMGLIDSETGIMYYFIAEHPRIVLFRDNKASFIFENFMLMKVGTTNLEGRVHPNVFQLKPGDVIFVGSDGKDDLELAQEEDDTFRPRRMNENENLFLEVVEECNGNLSLIFESLSKRGKIIDDLSIIKISFKYAKLQEKKDSPQILEKIQKIKDFYKEGKISKCREVLSTVPIDFYSLDITLHLARLSLILKSPQFALKILEKGLRQYPNSSDILFLISLSYKKLGEIESAIDFGERLRLIHPNHQRNLVNLVKLFAMRNHIPKVLEIWKELENMGYYDEKLFKLIQLVISKNSVHPVLNSLQKEENVV